MDEKNICKKLVRWGEGSQKIGNKYDIIFGQPPLAICWRSRNFFPATTRTSQRPSSRNQGKGGKHLPRQREARKSAKSIVARSVELLKRLPQNGLQSFLKQHSQTLRTKDVDLSGGPPFLTIDRKEKSIRFQAIIYLQELNPIWWAKLYQKCRIS